MLGVERFEKFSKVINQLSKELKKIKYKHMTKYGLGSVHVMCIISLAENPKQTANDLMTGEEIDKAQMSRVLKDLCEKGYIQPADGQNRKYRIQYELTNRGMEIASEIREKAANIVRFVDDGVSEENIVIMYHTLEKLYTNLLKAQNEFEE